MILVKRYLVFIATALIAFMNAGVPVMATSEMSLPVTPAAATETMMVDPYYSPVQTSSQTFLGQDQYYTVTFRGNGEAVVNLKVIFSNLTPDPISTVTLRMPKAEIEDVLGFQVLRESQCIRYDQAPIPTILPSQKPYYDGMNSINQYPTTKCAEYQAPDYYQYWYGVTKYQKAAIEIKGDSIVVGLPKAVKPDNSASFMLYYRASGFTKKNIFGAYSYAFETLKAEDKVRTLQVGISTDSDLVLKGATGTVEYLKQDVSNIAMGASKEMANTQLDSAYQQIGQGSIVKSSSNLQPLESYTVKGAYAPSTYALYGSQITLGIIAFLLILGVLVFFMRKVILHFRNQPSDKTLKTSATPDNGRAMLEVGLVSFFSSILIAGYTVVVMMGVTQFSAFYYSEMSLVLVLFVTIISFAVYSLFMFGPAIFLGMRRGYMWGLATFVMTTIFLVVYLLVIAGLIFIVRSNRGYPGYYPSPMYNQATPSKT